MLSIRKRSEEILCHVVARRNRQLAIFCLNILIVLGGCGKRTDQLFNLLPPETTGVEFINEILEDEYINIISYEYLYNGAGVAVGDFNNDGFQDLFFCGNMTSNRLYINQGDLRFMDITKVAGIDASDRWCTGVAVVDINEDGWQDIYVCASYNADPALRKNLMFIHNGLNQDGFPTFTEKAEEMGIDDMGYSTNAVFFDFDNDLDLDLYVLTNVLDTDFPNKYRSKINDGTSITNDRLYRNNGDGTFVNYTLQAGIHYEGYGLGISIIDMNQDGWKDIYITNDYLTNDILYINNQDGTFSNHISKFLKHMGHSAMGHDIADINNDGLPDIFTLDMLPEDNQRLKQMYAGSRFDNNQDNEKFGYEYQYKRNMLQLNNGPDAYGNHLFSEIGFLSNTIATDWSWSALLADFDNDGFRDLFISNGYPRDVTDLDYATSGSRRSMHISMEEELEQIPMRHIHNYLFRNNGNCTYTDKSFGWGFALPSYSTGAAYADLDNDGDLDIITNNINEPASIYENRLYTGIDHNLKNHYLRLRLKSKNFSSIGLGSIIYVFVKEEVIYIDHSTCHGFLSTMEPIIHIGLGEYEFADSLLLITPSWSTLTMYNIPADQLLDLELNDLDHDSAFWPATKRDFPNYMFRKMNQEKDITHLHKEDPFNDFNIQPAVPYQVSQMGPCATVADIDQNGEFDLFIGGSKSYPGSFYFQHKGKFNRVTLSDDQAISSEDQGAVFFDADADGDEDLFVVSGGNEVERHTASLQDRLYLNDGKGHFKRSVSVIPNYLSSGTCVKAADFDKDGDLDLFVGGGTQAGKYPFASQSHILRNDSSPDRLLFTDITEEVCPGYSFERRINDALWTDFDNDSNLDLVLAGEWMPITFLRNNGSEFEDVTLSSGLENLYGWWNSLAGGDFDNDGDIDYIAGNHGLNSYYKCTQEAPISALAADFDNNGLSDVIMSGYLKDIQGDKKEFPLHFRNDINRQLEHLRKKFPNFKIYSEATIDSIFSENELINALKVHVNHLETSYIENLGNGRFRLSSLPLKSQFSPVYGIMSGDFDDDQFLDVLLVGNFYGNNPFWGRMDALNGLLLKGMGNGQFTVLDYTQTGFLVSGDAKAIVNIPTQSGTEIILATQNQDSSRTFMVDRMVRHIELQPNDAWAELMFSGGSIRKQEFYYGDTYFSQSARMLYLPKKAISYKIFSYKSGGRDQ